MKTQTQKDGETLNISRDKLVSLVGQLFGGAGGNPNPDEPHKLGPWDPLIRKVAKQFFSPRPEPWHLIFGPKPEPWRAEVNLSREILGIIATRHPEIFDAIGSRINLAALNPQPLPPSAAFVAAFAEEAFDRILLMQEIADAANQTGELQSIIIVGGKVSQLVDELCGDRFKVKIPFPKPKHDEGKLLSGLELLAAGAIFAQNAGTVAHEGLRQELQNAGARLIETGIARM
jgi:hypothetical protein